MINYPKVTFGKNFPASRLRDYIIYDQSTGFPIWKSEAVKLGTYTGKGGLWVHNKVAAEAYNTDYGLVPYKVRAEMPIGQTTNNHEDPGGGVTSGFIAGAPETWGCP